MGPVREMKVVDQNSFASSTVAVHVLRGVIGLALLVCGFALIPAVGPRALILAPFGIVALRGCPTCWAIGLGATIARRRTGQACAERACRPARTWDRRPD